MNKLLAFLILALAVSVALNTYLLTSGDEVDLQAVKAQIRRETGAELKQQRTSHAQELDALQAQYERSIAEKQQAAEQVKAALAEEKRRALASQKAVKAALEKAAREPITEQPGGYIISNTGAKHLLEENLELKAAAATCKSACAVELEEQKRAIVPPLVAARQNLEDELLVMRGVIRMKDAEIAALRARDDRKEKVLIGVGAGVGGLLVGLATGAVGAAYVLK